MSSILHNRHSALLSRKQAAEYLGVSVGTLAVWACIGRYNLPMVKVGRLVKYRLVDLEAFITGNLIGGEAV